MTTTPTPADPYKDVFGIDSRQPSPARSDKDAGLLPCPFCGAHLPHMWSLTLDGKEHSITCTECPGRAVFKSSSREQAIAAWNRREGKAQESAPSGESIATWDERTDETAPNAIIMAMELEIADLCAALARRATAGTTASPVAEKWAIYYDNLGSEPYESQFMQAWQLYDSKGEAARVIDKYPRKAHYRPVRVAIYAGVDERATSERSEEKPAGTTAAPSALSQQLLAAASRPTMPCREPGSVLVHASLLRIAADEIEHLKAGWGEAFNLAIMWQERATAGNAATAAPGDLPSNDDVYAEVCRQRGTGNRYVSTNAVNDVMAAVRRLASNAGAAIPEPKKELAHGHRDDWYLMANARRIGMMPIRQVANMTNWSFAHELFATGSNSSHQICVDAGIDPAGYTVERAPSNPPAGATQEQTK